MTDFLKEYQRSWVQEICAHVLRNGPMPKHIGLIMDGNRRYARKQKLGNVSEGHRKGDEKLSQVCKMMVDFGIPEATAYFFSKENFKRTAGEVDGLMTIFTERMHRHLGELLAPNLVENGIGVEVIGDYKMATKPTLRHLFAKVTWCTRESKVFRLNVAFAYGGQAEISSGMDILNTGLNTGEITADDVDEKLLEAVFSTSSTNPVDLIIRTGGDRRLSDFLTWRGSNAHLEFFEVIKWPEFTYWDFLKSIWRYQIQVIYFGLRADDENGRQEITNADEFRKHEFLSKLRESMWKAISEDANKI